MNEKDNTPQRGFDDILLELMVQNETSSKIQASTLNVVDLLTPVADASKESLKRGSEASDWPSRRSSGQSGNSGMSEVILDGILLVAQDSLSAIKSVEAGIVMLADYSGLMRNSLSNISNDLSAFYNAFIAGDLQSEAADRMNSLQEKEKNAELLKLLERLGGGKRDTRTTTAAAPKEDGFLAKLLGPLGIIGGLLAGFVTGIVGYFTTLFGDILGSLSKMLNIGTFLSKIGLTSEFFAKLAAPFKTVFGKIGELFGKLTSFFSKTFGGLTEKFSKFLGIGKLIGRIAAPLMLIFDVFKSISAAVNKFSETGNIGAALETGISELFGRVIGAPLDLLKSAVSWILGKFGFDEAESFLDSFSFTDIIQEFISRLVAWGKQSFEMVFQTLLDVFGDISEKFSSGDILGGIIEVLRGLVKTLVALPFDLIKTGMAKVAGMFGADEFAKKLESFSFRGMMGGTNTATEAEAAPPEKSIFEAAGETTAAKQVAKQVAKQMKDATENIADLDEQKLAKPATTLDVNKPKGLGVSGLIGSLSGVSDAFYKALQENLTGGQTQRVGGMPSTIGSEMAATLSNTRDLESNAEMAAAMAPAATGGSKKTTNVSAQSVTYNSNNIPDRTSWMITPLANWSL